MAFLIAAYLAAWGAVAVYWGWLTAQNRQIARRLDEIEAQVRQSDDGGAFRRVA